ncbi:C1 family peptidase [Brevibacillus sp. HD1.4A]|uniref:C1 family peptidase n=1 Tax=Brevibacillus sp. HD1.4A TaxID=2738978 RepID=UPI00156AE8A2|nr:C1 family peptidase [Brevibacillus sp. HD1.4A]NRQ56333.1 C1 family peptidase [Brevibacillus sp. HD1.4A]
MPQTNQRIYNPIVDLRTSFFPVQDQGPRPTCVAFATTACNEVHHKREKLSEEFLYRCCKIREKNELDGTYAHIALDNLNIHGQPSASFMPYEHSFLGSVLTTPIALSTFRNAKKFRITDWQQLKSSHVIIEDELRRGVPVLAIVEVQQGFFEANKTYNFIDVPSTITFRQSYHAIVIAGFGLDEQGVPYYLIRNSWGTGWGASGYAYMSYSYFDAFRAGTWSIC